MTNTKNYQEKMLQSSIAMTVTLISFGMLFAALFLGYFLVRFNTPVWPPVEIQGMPKLLPFLSTLAIGLSSLTYYVMERNEKGRKTFWTLTFLLGLGFLFLQWNLWEALKSQGIYVSNGSVPSMVFAFSWIHAAHIVLALSLLCWPGLYIFRNKEKVTELMLINVGKFWHFLGIIWLLMYLMMFVL